MIARDNSLPQLPESWVWTRLGDIAQVITGNTPSKKDPENYGKDIPFVKPPELNDCVITSSEDNLSQKGAAIARVLPPDAVLVSCIGILGKTGISKVTVAFNQQINAAVFYEGALPKYGFYYSQTLRNWLYGVASATTLPIVNKSRFELAPVPLPPLPEQQRIVAKTEELFTKLDAGVGSLKQVKAQLKGYRRAVLKHAFEGKLTKEWREARKGEMEPASLLLERIREERKKNAKGKYKELPPLDTPDLPELPEGWIWTSLEELAESERNAIKAGPFGSSLKKEFYVTQGYKLYGQEQVIREDPFYGDYYINDERYAKLKSCAVKPGDMLISLVGTIGKVLVLPEAIEPGIINPRLVKFSLEKRLVSNAYIKAYIESSAVRHFFSLLSHGGTMDILNLTILKKLPVSLPPLPEQNTIVEEIERCFSVADAIEKDVEQSLKQAERLRQSILKRAFGGKLVPQDPNDEPAQKLLERIKAEKAKREAEKKAIWRGRKRLNTIQGRLM